jgi:hypothetical protein
MLCCHWLWPSATCRQPTQPLPACLRAEEAHATSFGPYASTTAAALAEQKGGEGRFLSAAHMLEEAWAW